MNVLLLADNPAFGGTSRYCMNLALGLRQLGLEVSILAPIRSDLRHDDWLTQESRNHNFTFDTLLRTGAFDLKSVRELGRRLKAEQVDIIHSQGYLSNVLARLAIQLERAKTHSVVTFHAWSPDKGAPLRHRAYNWLDILTTPWTTQAIAVDATVQRDYQTRGVPGRKITVIPNGVKLWESDAPRPPHERYVVGFVGRMSYEKGITPLVNIIRDLLPNHPNMEFLVVGDGPEMSQLEVLKNQPYGDRLKLPGRVVDVNPYYEQMDVLIIPSLREALPFTVLEVMTHHVPVIANAVGGLPGVIDHEKNGILVPPLGEAEMKDWIVRLQDDPALRHALGEQAARTIEEQYSIQVMSRKTLDVYQRAMG